jgi:hypothetical protein
MSIAAAISDAVATRNIIGMSRSLALSLPIDETAAQRSGRPWRDTTVRGQMVYTGGVNIGEV